MPGFSDPMLFSDEDGRLFFYWGCTMSGGIWGVELDANHPTNVITRPVELIPFRAGNTTLGGAGRLEPGSDQRLGRRLMDAQA